MSRKVGPESSVRCGTTSRADLAGCCWAPTSWCSPIAAGRALHRPTPPRNSSGAPIAEDISTSFGSCIPTSILTGDLDHDADSRIAAPDGSSPHRVAPPSHRARLARLPEPVDPLRPRWADRTVPDTVRPPVCPRGQEARASTEECTTETNGEHQQCNAGRSFLLPQLSPR